MDYTGGENMDRDEYWDEWIHDLNDAYFLMVKEGDMVEFMPMDTSIREILELVWHRAYDVDLTIAPVDTHTIKVIGIAGNESFHTTITVKALNAKKLLVCAKQEVVNELYFEAVKQYRLDINDNEDSLEREINDDLLWNIDIPSKLKHELVKSVKTYEDIANGRV